MSESGRSSPRTVEPNRDSRMTPAALISRSCARNVAMTSSRPMHLSWHNRFCESRLVATPQGLEGLEGGEETGELGLHADRVQGRYQAYLIRGRERMDV